MSVYLDAHCHLGDFLDPLATLAEAPGTVVVAVTELPSRYRLLTSRFRADRRVRVALGLHPLRASTAGPLEEGQLTRLLEDAEYVGEVGLDFSAQGRESRSAQRRVFDRLLGAPEIRKKVITVHSRSAETTVIRCLREVGVAAILHWYSGPPALVDEALDAGLYFSLNARMLTTKKGRLTASALPADRVLTESDGPYGGLRRRDSRPADIPGLITELARLWKIDPQDARGVVYKNMATLHARTVGGAGPGEQA